MPILSKEDKLRLLTTILESRHADLREQNLNRQGKGHFHVSGMGHEALAAISMLMEPDDYIVPYYRDRGLVLGRGMTTRELALEYFAKRDTGSGGRQMPSHYSHANLHIWSVPTPTGSELLPACGIAWGIKLDEKKNLVVTTVGDAATRQGDFFEAVCFANEILPAGKYRVGDTVNKTLRAGLEEDPGRIIFGEDIEDAKGGVFRLTQRLSTEFPKQVFNSPLAESTILGVGCGLAAYGKRHVFELQFIDFIYPGFNQLITNISTLRWRSFGNWKCPAVIYAPYGAYLPGGSLWHSQANEG